MILLPALSGISALIQLILEGALIGALFGGAIGGSEAVITEYQAHGEINQQGIENVAKQAGEGAIDGAVWGSVTGGIFGVAGPALHPVLAMIDDFFRSILGWFDDAARSVLGTVDDAFTGIKNTANSAVNGIRALTNRARNGWNARNFANLDKGIGNKGYVYVMDDITTPGRYKIGKTIDPPTRIKRVQSDTGLKLDYSCIIGTDDMKSLEKSLHHEFDRQRRRKLVPGATEIFLLNATQLASACSR